MIPRCNVVSIPLETSKEELAKLILENQYTRYPVYVDNFDNVQGILHVKDLYSCNLRNEEANIKDILRQPLFVPETIAFKSACIRVISTMDISSIMITSVSNGLPKILLVTIIMSSFLYPF